MTDTDSNEQAQNLPAVQQSTRVPIMAGATPRALVPVDFDGAYRIARVVVEAGMAPRTLNTIPKAMVAIMHGMEVGLTPMNALQAIAVINGKPTIYGDGAIGLVRASGLLEYMEEYYENEDKPNMKAICVVKRKGEPKPVKSDFSMADAQKAGLLAKEGPWQTYTKRMLKMRARWPLRDVFSDVLKGLAIREEQEDIEPTPAEPATVQRRAPPPPEETKQEVVKEEPKTEPAKQDNPPVDDFPGDKPLPKDDGLDIPPMLDRRAPAPPDETEEWLKSLENAFSGCEDTASLAEEQTRLMMPEKGKVDQKAWTRAMEITKAHLKRIQEAPE